MPEYYTGENIKAIQEARDKELEYQKDKQDRVYDDMYISTAKDIDLWENEYGVAPTTDDLERRQKNMLAYVRSSRGIATKDTIINLVSSYTGSDDVTIEEFPNEFLAKIRCTYHATEDISFSDVEAMLYEMIQAHADFVIDRIKINYAESSIYKGLKLKGQYAVKPVIST